MDLNESFIVVSYFESYITLVRLDLIGPGTKFKLGNKCSLKTIPIVNSEFPVRRNVILREQMAVLWWNKDCFNQWVNTGTQHNLIVVDLDKFQVIGSDSVVGEIILVSFATIIYILN